MNTTHMRDTVLNYIESLPEDDKSPVLNYIESLPDDDKLQGRLERLFEVLRLMQHERDDNTYGPILKRTQDEHECDNNTLGPAIKRVRT